MGASESLRNMLRRSFGARSFAGFWQHWNPVFGYCLGTRVFIPLKRIVPHRNGHWRETMVVESDNSRRLPGCLPRLRAPAFPSDVTTFPDIRLRSLAAPRNLVRSRFGDLSFKPYAVTPAPARNIYRRLLLTQSGHSETPNFAHAAGSVDCVINGPAAN